MNINYLATYMYTILKEDRHACVVDTSKANTAITVLTQSQQEGRLLCKSSVHGKRLTAAFLLINLACMAVMDETLSCLLALQAKQKPRELHRNKRYVVQHKNRHNTCTCVFSLVFVLFVPSNKRDRLKCNTS